MGQLIVSVLRYDGCRFGHYISIIITTQYNQPWPRAASVPNNLTDAILNMKLLANGLGFLLDSSILIINPQLLIYIFLYGLGLLRNTPFVLSSQNHIMTPLCLQFLKFSLSPSPTCLTAWPISVLFISHQPYTEYHLSSSPLFCLNKKKGLNLT